MKQAQLTIKMWREREQSAYHNMESCLSSAVAYHGIVSYIEYPDRGRLAFWLWCKYHNCTIPSLCVDGMATSYWAGFWMPLAWCCQKPFHCTCQCIFCMHDIHTLWISINQSLYIMSRERERERATRFVARWRARQRRARGRWVDGQCARIVLFDDIMWMWVKDAETWIVSQPEEPNPSPSLFCSSNLAWLNSST